ncbi:type VII secretion target [Streptomyces sp. DSM 44917]|uniref:Type VII secretion target n=1 Tax=Streptomyces boetiae TaxID=3075541 RepID=A0ABU2LEU7_9ACTN|nr:type VII secretion target [Streptomyces sp. DSM 44917]MDT0310031.1 type VII secretion target [Streptomyces sp. DSM 44917]
MAAGAEGAGWADLDVDTDMLEQLARRSERLVRNLDSALSGVRGEGAGAVATSAGLTSLSRLERVSRSWEARLGAVRQECVTMGEALGTAAGMLVATEDGIRGAIGAAEARMPGSGGD